MGDSSDDGVGDGSPDKLYRLTWPEHQPNRASFLSASLSKESFADVTLVSTEGSRIRAHKIILSSCSQYFEEIFLNNPSDHPVVILKDVQFVDLQAIVNFIYNGELNVDGTRATDIIKTASTLQIKFLSDVSLKKLDHESNGSPEEKFSNPVQELSSPIAYPRTPSPPVSSSLTARRSWTATTSTALTAGPTKCLPNDLKVDKKLVVSKKSASADNTNISSSPQKTENVTKSRSNTTLVSGVGSSKSLVIPGQGSGSGNSSSSSNNQSSFVVTIKKKKEAWVDPDAISVNRSQQNKKRLKQTNLFSLALRLPQSQTKVDVSKTKDYNCSGARVRTQTSSNLTVQNQHGKEKMMAGTGTKRKSDESVDVEEEQRDIWETPCLDLSQTCYEASPMKGPNACDDVVISSPLPGTSKNTRERHKSPRSPLSPGKMNIIDPVIEPSPDKSKKKFSKAVDTESQFDSTLNILKDFDKIPEHHFNPAGTSKQGRNQGKKKQDRYEPEPELKCTCTAKDLESCLDKKEVSRLNKDPCPVHGSGNPQPLLTPDTPENFWCTIQYTTQELYDKGLINVASPFTPPVARRRRRNSNDSFIDADTENSFDGY